MDLTFYCYRMKYYGRKQYSETNVTRKIFIVDKNILISEMKPMLWLLRIMGLFPYTITENGNFNINLLQSFFNFILKYCISLPIELYIYLFIYLCTRIFSFIR